MHKTQYFLQGAESEIMPLLFKCGMLSDSATCSFSSKKRKWVLLPEIEILDNFKSASNSLCIK